MIRSIVKSSGLMKRVLAVILPGALLAALLVPGSPVQAAPNPNAPQPPLAPSDLVAQAQMCGAQLQWRDHSTNESGFRLFYRFNSSSPWTWMDLGPNVTQKSISNGNINGLVQAYVKAYRVVNNVRYYSAPTNVVSVQTQCVN